MSLHQQNLSSNQRNTLFLKRNSILQVLSFVDDDSELTDKYGETNTNPYVDTTANNEDENLNTKTVERGQKLYYQVWLDTTKFDANNKDNIQTVGIDNNYDKDKLTVNASDIQGLRFSYWCRCYD